MHRVAQKGVNRSGFLFYPASESATSRLSSLYRKDCRYIPQSISGFLWHELLLTSVSNFVNLQWSSSPLRNYMVQAFCFTHHSEDSLEEIENVNPWFGCCRSLTIGLRPSGWEWSVAQNRCETPCISARLCHDSHTRNTPHSH